MKNFDSHIEENDLDNLLRQFVLDGDDDEFTKNTLTMNADFIFTSAPQLTPDAAREIALIQKLEKAFVKPRGFGKFWLNGFLIISLLIGSFAVYKYNSGTDVVSTQHSNNEKNNLPSIISSSDTSGNTQQTKTISVPQISSSEIIPDSVSSADTVPVQEKTHSEKSAASNDVIQIERNWYSGNYAVNIPGPVFSAKASPENFKSTQGVFKIDTSRSAGTMFTCKQATFSSSYYTGIPFKSGMNDMQYFNYGEFVHDKNNNWEIPWPVLGYADTSEVKVETKNYLFQNQKRSYTSIIVNKLPDKGMQLALQPFYFRKYEVTNKEYREFVNWVRASNGYANKPICTFRVDTALVTDSLEWGGEELTIKGKKYRIHRTSVPAADYKNVYNYVFFNQNSDAVKQLGKNSLYIFPDTASWIKDFTLSYNEPMANYYFWHPAYDNYPVVGVNWFQAMAFLDWKTHFHQQQLDAENIPYEIEYTLPSDIEWELASISESVDKKIEFNPVDESTGDWITNLALSFPGHDDPYQTSNYLKNLFTKDEHFNGDYIEDGYFHTGPADLSSGKNQVKNSKHLDNLGISWMDGNVSEWMSESYAENWKPFFQKHLLVLDADTSESTQLAKQIEMLYDKGNAANGRLVRGANWYDERFGGKPGTGRNETGINPKRFVNPSEQHSTIGFRYVVHVKRK